MSAVSGAQQPPEAVRLNWCNGSCCVTWILPRSATWSVRRAAPTGRKPSAAARSSRWHGRHPSSCSPAPSGTAAATCGRCRPRSAPPRVSRCGTGPATAAAPSASTARTSPRWSSPRRTRRCSPSASPAPRRPGGPRCRGSSRSTRCSARRDRPARRTTRTPVPPTRAPRWRSSCPWCRTPRSLPPGTPPTTPGTNPTTAPAAAQAAGPAGARGRSGAWVAGNLTWSRLDYLLLRDEYPAAHVRLLHELYALYRASATAQDLLLRIRLRVRRRPEVPRAVRLRVPPALAGPRAGARRRPAARLPAQAGPGAAARHRGAVPRRHQRRHGRGDHAADRPGHQDPRRR